MALNGDLHAPTASPPESNNTWYKRMTGSVDLRPGLGAVENKTLCRYHSKILSFSASKRAHPNPDIVGKALTRRKHLPFRGIEIRPLPECSVTRQNRNQRSSVDSIPART